MSVPAASSRVISYAIALALILLVTSAGPASAHASLVSSDPDDGSSLASVPTSVTYTFNDEISDPAYVAVTAPDGSSVAVADVSVAGAVVTATLDPSDQRGRYTASYRVVSTDGHPAEGDIRFTTTSGRKVTQVEPAGKDTFVHRHRAPLFLGILGVTVAIALLRAPLRRPNG